MYRNIENDVFQKHSTVFNFWKKEKKTIYTVINTDATQQWIANSNKIQYIGTVVKFQNIGPIDRLCGTK